MIAYTCSFLFSIVSPMWLGPGAGTVNDLVMPRMRAMASAFYLLMVTFIGLALGPFTIGQLSDAFAAAGMTPADALRRGMLWGLIPLGAAVVFLVLALRYLESDETEPARPGARGRRAGLAPCFVIEAHPSGNRLAKNGAIPRAT